MNHYVYQITNNINGKIYIGKRSCKCSIEDDTYFGSGTYLKAAIKKCGKENFTKTVIDVCDSLETAYELEAFIVDADFLKRNDTYNLCGGGIGGGVGECGPMFGKVHSDESRVKISANHAHSMKGKTLSEETKAKISANHGMKGKHHTDEAKAKISINNVGMKGKPHTDETKAKMSEANKGRVSPNKGKIRSPETIAKQKATRLKNKLKIHIHN